MDVERSALTRNLTVMAKNGLIERIEGEDRREKIVSLSDLGQERLKEGQPLWKQAQKGAVAQLGDDASRQLLLSLNGFD